MRFEKEEQRKKNFFWIALNGLPWSHKSLCTLQNKIKFFSNAVWKKILLLWVSEIHKYTNLIMHVFCWCLYYTLGNIKTSSVICGCQHEIITHIHIQWTCIISFLSLFLSSLPILHNYCIQLQQMQKIKSFNLTLREIIQLNLSFTYSNEILVYFHFKMHSTSAWNHWRWWWWFGLSIVFVLTRIAHMCVRRKGGIFELHGMEWAQPNI